MLKCITPKIYQKPVVMSDFSLGLAYLGIVNFHKYTALLKYNLI